MTNSPAVDDAIAILTEIIESTEPLHASMRLTDVDVDSLDILEWMFELGIDTDDLFEEGGVLEFIETLTLGDLYSALITADSATEPRVE